MGEQAQRPGCAHARIPASCACVGHTWFALAAPAAVADTLADTLALKNGQRSRMYFKTGRRFPCGEKNGKRKVLRIRRSEVWLERKKPNLHQIQ